MQDQQVLNRGRRFGAWFVAEYRLRNMSKWLTAIIFESFATPLIYLLAIGIGIGSLVDANTGGQGVNGVSYVTFLAPALLATAAIQAVMNETSFPTLEGFVWEKTFFGMNSTQLNASQIVDGVLLSALIRAVLTSGIYLAVLYFFGAVEIPAMPLMFLFSTLAGMAFGSLMLAATSFVKEDDGFFAVVFRFIVTPMFLFSGTFYPLEQMPFFLQWIGWLSPLWHSTNLSRAVSYGLDVPLWLQAIHILFLLACLGAGLLISKWQFARRLEK